MRCAICLQPLHMRYWRVPVIQSPNLLEGLLILDDAITQPTLDVIDVCKSCAVRQRGVFRALDNRELVVRLTSPR